jgi:hypothetical protein
VGHRDLFPQDALYLSVRGTGGDDQGGSLKFKLHDKAKALELLGRHRAMFKDRLELEGFSFADLASMAGDEKADEK